MGILLEVVDKHGRVKSQVCLSDWRFYVVSQELIQVEDRVAFCHNCQAFVAAEWLRQSDCVLGYENYLNQLPSRERDQEEFVYGSVAEKRLHASKMARVFENRRSPSRCLECGGIQVELPDLDDRGLASNVLYVAECQGTPFRTRVAGLASTKSWYRLYDREGSRMNIADSEIVEIVNVAEGRPIAAIKRNGRRYYGSTYGYAEQTDEREPE